MAILKAFSVISSPFLFPLVSPVCYESGHIPHVLGWKKIWETSAVINQSSYSESLSRFSGIEDTGDWAKLQFALIELSLCRPQLCEQHFFPFLRGGGVCVSLFLATTVLKCSPWASKCSREGARERAGCVNQFRFKVIGAF